MSDEHKEKMAWVLVHIDDEQDLNDPRMEEFPDYCEGIGDEAMSCDKLTSHVLCWREGKLTWGLCDECFNRLAFIQSPKGGLPYLTLRPAENPDVMTKKPKRNRRPKWISPEAWREHQK